VSFTPAARPTMYFIGVTTGSSAIRRVFPLWAEALGIPEADLVGIDLAPGSPAEAYREVVSWIARDELSVGALVTTHKIDLYLACRDLFVGFNPDAVALEEVSCIAKRPAGLLGMATDPVSVGLALDAFLPSGHWQRTGAAALLLGAGGSATALMCHLAAEERGAARPERIVATSRRAERLEKIRRVHELRGLSVPLETRRADGPLANDAALAGLPPGSLVVNATGLGKDAPGSPLTNAAEFPMWGLAWDFNYRGDLIFLEQARRQQAGRGLRLEDGWVYFIHGWTRVIAEVFQLDVPTAGPAFDRLATMAEVVR
jgi:shikimate 5-dehydrogenase